MLDPATSSAALAAMGMYVYLSVAIASMDGHDKPQVFVEQRPAEQLSVPAPAPRTEEVLQVRGDLQYDEHALTEGPRLAADRSLDSVEAFRAIPVPKDWTSPRYIVGWRPVVAQHACPDGTTAELVHHMNLHSVPQDTFAHMQENPTDIGYMDDRDDVARVVATYDRGAEEYRLPPGYGIEVGPGGPQPGLLLEYHLLKPKCWDFAKGPVHEDSGFDVFVTADRPRKLANIFGYTDETLRVPAKVGQVKHVSELSRDVWVGLPLPLELVAVHLHTHDKTSSKQLEVVQKHGFQPPTSWSSPLEVMAAGPGHARGYGPTQSMKNVESLKGWPRIELDGNTKLRMHCNYDTDEWTETVIDGTSWGEEMCSLLFIAGLPDHGEKRLGTVIQSKGGYDTDAFGAPPTWRRLFRDAANALQEGFRRLI